MPKLIIHSTDSREERDLGSEPVTCGRSSANNIIVPDDRASREHCRFELDGGKWYVTDLDSSNGTYVDGRRVTRQELTNGAVVRVGKAHIAFVDEVDQTRIRQEEPEQPRTGLKNTLLTRRVKIIAAVAAAIVLLAILSELLTPAKPKAAVYPANLLTTNPSFEEGAGSNVPGWTRTKGSASLDDKQPADGTLALRLASAPGAGRDVSALCWSPSAKVAPGKVYEFSALVKNSGSEAAALCAAWSSKELPWLQTLELGVRTGDALEWRRVAESFVAPSWATGARFGFALVGQGTAKFDGTCLRETAPRAPENARRLAAGRIQLEHGPHGEWNVLADNQPIIGRGRLTVTAAGSSENQSLGKLDKGYPQAEPKMVKFAGALGLQGKLPFDEAISSDETSVSLHYNLDLSSAGNDAVLAIEWLSGRSLLAGPVILETARGVQTTKTAPFDNAPGVTTITFFSGEKRVFLRLSTPASVSAAPLQQAQGGVSLSNAATADDAVVWRLEFPNAPPRPSTGAGPAEPAAPRGDSIPAKTKNAPDTGRTALSLTWTATDREKTALVAIDLRRAVKAEEDEEFGKAAKLYHEFAAKHPLYATERTEAARRLKLVRDEIIVRNAAAMSLAAKARTSHAEADFVAAESACETLIGKLKGDDTAAELAKTLATLKIEHKTAIEKKDEQDAADFLPKAKQDIERQEFNTARARLEYVIKKYPNTKPAQEARELLKTLPKPE